MPKQVSTPDDWYDGGEDYSAGTTGGDSTNWSEKSVPECPQRGRRPALNLSPEGDDFYTQNTFNDKPEVLDDYNDYGAIDNNFPVPQREKRPFFDHGWQVEPSEALPGGESGAPSKQSSKPKPRN